MFIIITVRYLSPSLLVVYQIVVSILLCTSHKNFTLISSEWCVQYTSKMLTMTIVLIMTMTIVPIMLAMTILPIMLTDYTTNNAGYGYTTNNICYVYSTNNVGYD